MVYYVLIVPNVFRVIVTYLLILVKDLQSVLISLMANFNVMESCVKIILAVCQTIVILIQCYVLIRHVQCCSHSNNQQIVIKFSVKKMKIASQENVIKIIILVFVHIKYVSSMMIGIHKNLYICVMNNLVILTINVPLIIVILIYINVVNLVLIIIKLQFNFQNVMEYLVTKMNNAIKIIAIKMAIIVFVLNKVVDQDFYVIIKLVLQTVAVFLDCVLIFMIID
jgi:hypothetical protein